MKDCPPFIRVGSYNSSDHKSFSSLAQRCRFSITRESILGSRTSCSGACVTEAIAGATKTQVASTVVARIRLQKFLAILSMHASLGTPGEVFMVFSVEPYIPLSVDSLLTISDR